MKCKTIQCDNGKEITIIDDAVTLPTMTYIYFICCSLNYQISNSSSTEIQGIVDRRLKSDIENNHPIIDCLFDEKTNSFKEIKKCIPPDTYGFDRGYVNLGIHGDVNQIHTDNVNSCKTILYYANKHWEYNWGGHTLFYNDEGDLQTTVEVKPGRIVVFDGIIPHTVMPMNIRCSPSYRFTVAIKFVDLNSHKFEIERQ